MPIGSSNPASLYLDKTFIFWLPNTTKIIFLHVVADLIRGGLEFIGIELIDGLIGNQPLPVLQADWIYKNKPLDAVGKHQGEPGCQHAANGVTHHGYLIDIKTVQQSSCIRGKLLKVKLEVFRFR